MNKIKLALLTLLLPLFAVAQNTVTLPGGTTAYTPQFRYIGTDSLKSVWVYTGSSYNQWYTATQLNKFFPRLAATNLFTGTNVYNGTATFQNNVTLNSQVSFRGNMSITGGMSASDDSYISYNGTGGQHSFLFDGTNNQLLFGAFPTFNWLKIQAAGVSVLMPPSNQYHLTNKRYVDSLGAAGVAGSVPNTRTISTGYGLSGGGDLSANRTHIVDTTVIVSKPNLASQMALKLSKTDTTAMLANVVHKALNETITGTKTFQKSGIGTTTTEAAIFSNPAAATAGVVYQIPPSFTMEGSYWDTGTLTSKTAKFRQRFQPVSGTGTAGNLYFSMAFNGGSYTDVLNLSQSGVISPLLGFAAFSSANDAFVSLPSAGAQISRNRSDANPALIINNVLGTGDIFRIAQNMVTKFTVDLKGNSNQTGQSFITQMGAGLSADSIVTHNNTSKALASKAIVAGAGISITPTATSITIAASPNVVEISGTSQSATGNTIYIPHNAALTTIAVPTTTVIGTLYQVIGEGAGGWKLQLPASTIAVGVGGFTTTAAGSLSSTDRYCTITIRYAAANKFVVTTSQGTITPL